MAVNLDTLIEKIKTQGIEESKKSAEEIISNASKEADSIRSQAEARATQIIEQAEQESTTIVNRGKDALKQAQRDLLLTLEGQIKTLFEKFIAQATHDSLDANHLKDIISTALSKWTLGANENIFIHLSESDAQKITKESLSGAVQAQGANIEIKVDPNITSGFRISKQDGGNFAFDFTADAITSALSVFLTPNVQELLK